jgi:hypothetical protein
MRVDYYKYQLNRSLRLIQDGFFDREMGGGLFRQKPHPFVLLNGLLNLYPAIREESLAYFHRNGIKWSLSGNFPSGHVLSSQIACLNHLFPLRQSQKAALSLLKAVSSDFVEALPIEERMPGLIMFEATGGEAGRLNEKAFGRGGNCTSVDALARARHEDGRRFLILINWKYVESYSNDDMSAGSQGQARLSRYLGLIKDSRLLNSAALSCCWFKPFYQLMRETLWAERMLRRRPKGFEADDFLHLHVIPGANSRLLDKRYKCSGLGLEATWRRCLSHPGKYVVISPEKLWSLQDERADLLKYLKTRYW